MQGFFVNFRIQSNIGPISRSCFGTTNQLERNSFNEYRPMKNCRDTNFFSRVHKLIASINYILL